MTAYFHLQTLNSLFTELTNCKEEAKENPNDIDEIRLRYSKLSTHFLHVNQLLIEELSKAKEKWSEYRSPTVKK